MPITNDLLARIQRITNSPKLCLCPVGSMDNAKRGIASVRGFGRLESMVKATFGAAVVAAALMSSDAHAGVGVGYDAGVYGQQQGQVMQAGTATRMQVVSVRPVMIEVTVPAKQNNQTMGYAVTVAAAGTGAVLGNNVFKSDNQSVRQLGAILGGLAGAFAGDKANKAMNAPEEAKQIPGVELTLVNPVDQRLSVITQTGEQQFAENDRVLVSSVGGSVRVVLDRSQQVEGVDHAHEAAMSKVFLVNDVTRSAGIMGIRVDKSQVATVLEHGAPDHGTFTGKVVGVDREAGLLFQSTGRGAGVVHELASLSKVPDIGSDMTVRFNNGYGLVSEREQGRGQGR